MLESGFLLNYVSCKDYFSSAGTTQRWVIVANDFVAAAGTLATSVLALTHAGTAAVSATALGTSTFAAGATIYTKDFLFSAENIDSVRTLTIDAMHQHQIAVPRDNLTAYTAMTAILDDQDMCSVPYIATLVRKAIQIGTPLAVAGTGRPITRSGPARGALAASEPAPPAPETHADNPPPTLADAQLDAADMPVRSALDKLLNDHKQLGGKQIQGLYWLLYGNPTQQEKDGPICEALVHLPNKTSPVERHREADGKDVCQKYKPNWPQQEKVTNLLKTLTRKSTDIFDVNIAKYRAGERVTEANRSRAKQDSGRGNTQQSPSTHINVDVF
ncbi:hypothetical protein [Burkholderia contaminans]|uniref:hypothetical protein n=1 Tax=Burkholderia contaminans TaxID=488447 RepID=UPI000F5A5864|nr:hypothetical protein [Burkholderia contaminans]